MTTDFFDTDDFSFDENHFFFCELFRSIHLNCKNENEFLELKELVDQYPNEKSNYHTLDFFHLIKSTFNKYEIAKNYEMLLKYKNSLNEITTINKSLQTIWLPNSKISIEDFFEKGHNKGLWDKNKNIILKRSSPYGSGKTFLGSLSVALKGYAINQSADYKLVGEQFCNAFNVKIDSTKNNPYKAFQSGNSKYIGLLKREFGVI